MKQILLVEDSSNDIELAMEALSEVIPANDIIVARDGQQALDYFQSEGIYANRQSENPILVMLDLKLPRISGIEVLRQAKSSISSKSIPIVMLTSSKEDSDLHTCYDLGANGYIVKPVGFEEYAQTIRAVGDFWISANKAPPPYPFLKEKFV